MNKLIAKYKSLKFFWKLIINLLAMVVTGLLLCWLSTFFLDIWTHHGREVVVPDVKGLSFQSAKERLESMGFEVVLQDSLYDDRCRPGEVVEQNPKHNNNVKPGRTIYLTINAFYPRTVMVPSLTDISIRQARMTLEGLGLKNYVITTIPSDYKDLVLNVVYDGKRLVPGTRLPLDAVIILEVGEGSDDLESPADDMPADSLAATAQVADLPGEKSGEQQSDDDTNSYFD